LNLELRTSNFFGVDVGGTTTRVGLVSAEGKLIASDRFETPRSSESLVDHLAARIGSLRTADASVGALGLALPGLVDPARGTLIRSVNLPFLQGFPIVDELVRRTSLEVSAMTDADAATWGEYAACPSSPARFIHLRFGTGIACGVVVEGVPHRSAVDRRTHLPELVVDDRTDAPECVCGLRGCLELFASGPAIARRAGHRRLPADLPELEIWLHGEQADAMDFAGEVAEWIVRGVRGALGLLPGAEGSGEKPGPAVVTLGGGVFRSLRSLAGIVLDAWNTEQDNPNRADLRRARLGDDAGVIGAALLAATTPSGSP